MQPTSLGDRAPRNQWYIAAFSHEVTRAPIERWLLNEPVALYRIESGKAVALDGRCPHHYFPLGKSAVAGDNLECGYHGMTFAPDGQCVRMPTISKVPGTCNIRSYPIVERWKWLWIWPGDPALADESLIPDHAAVRLTDPAFDNEPFFHFEVPARYQLLHDNLLDLTHIEFLHGATIGTEKISVTEEDRSQGDTTIRSVRMVKDISVPPHLKDRVAHYKGNVDREFSITFHLPCLHAGYEIYRAAEGTKEAGRSFGTTLFYHAVTPATRNSLHYFFARGRDWMLGDEATTERAKELLFKVIQEDAHAVTEVERMISASDTLRPEAILASDRTLVQGRRLLEKMIMAEQPNSGENAGSRKPNSKKP